MDAFESFGLSRDLVVDLGVLDQRVREASKRAHPDSGGSETEFEDIRRRGEELKMPLSRLRLAIRLAGGEAGSRGSVDGEVMEFFGPVAGVLEEVEKVIEERASARSGLGRAVVDAKVPGVKRDVERLIEELGGFESRLVVRFEEFDQKGWEKSLEAMSETARALAFVSKWKGQLQAATGKLFEALLGG